jgi:hypothetical protein
VIPFTGGASEPSNMLLPGKAGGTVAVRRTLACTICRIVDPTQVPRPRQLRDASTVMRFRPAHQSMINRRFDDPASCLARKSPTQALACKPQIHSPASGNGGHESAVKMIWLMISIVASRIKLALAMSSLSPARVASRTATSAAPTPETGIRAAIDARTHLIRKKTQHDGRGASMRRRHAQPHPPC